MIKFHQLILFIATVILCLIALQSNMAQGLALDGYLHFIYRTKIGTITRSPTTPDNANMTPLHSCTELNSKSRS
jgi:hypothetical protein